jgi:hypothetical protein
MIAMGFPVVYGNSAVLTPVLLSVLTELKDVGETVC